MSLLSCFSIIPIILLQQLIIRGIDIWSDLWYHVFKILLTKEIIIIGAYMLVSKNIQIDFADPSMKAVNAIHDIREGVRSASLNLYSRYDVQIQTPMLYDVDKVVVEIKIPEEIVETFSIGPHLKGISNYLLKNCNGRYDQYLVGKRLLMYTEVATPNGEDNKFSEKDRLESVAKFAKLLQRSDEEAMAAISQILLILDEDNDEY